MPNMKSKNLFMPFKPRRAFEDISDQIRDLIYSGVFKPGDKLPPERELAIQFKTGRMAVREALRILEESGFIYTKQGSFGGAFVKNADPSVMTRSISDLIKIGNVSLRELTEVRLGIEKAILEYCFKNIDQNDLKLLKENIEETQKTFLEGGRATEFYTDFHMLLAKSSKNSLFEMIIEAIMRVTRSFLLSSEKPDINHHKSVLRYHREIYKALEEEDFQKVREKMEEHIMDVNRRLSKSIKWSDPLHPNRPKG